MPSHAGGWQYLGAVLGALAIVLHVIGIGTPNFAESSDFRPLFVENGQMTIGLAKRSFKTGLFRLCTDGCLYPDLGGGYKCLMKHNNDPMIAPPELCFNMAPGKPEEDIQGDNGVESPDWLMAAQAFCITGLIMTTCGGMFICVFYGVCKKCRGGKASQEDFRTYTIIMALSFIVGGIVSFVGDIIFATLMQKILVWDGSNDVYDDLDDTLTDYYDDVLDLDWGFWVEIVGGILSVLAGFCLFLGHCFPPSKTVEEQRGWVDRQ